MVGYITQFYDNRVIQGLKKKKNATLAGQHGTKLRLTRLYKDRVLHKTRLCYYRVTKEGHFPN